MTGRPAARSGDTHVCPQVEPQPSPHLGGAVTEGSADTRINGQPAARAGDCAVCNGPPTSVSEGSQGVFINGQRAARVGDATDHGGRIALGSPTVRIGDRGGRAGRARGSSGAQSARIYVLHADYDQSGSVEANMTEYGKRLIRPGAVLLPNLDVDLPALAEGRALSELDGYQERLRSNDLEVSAARLEASPEGSGEPRGYLLAHAPDPRRFRAFRASGGPAVLGVESPHPGTFSPPPRLRTSGSFGPPPSEAPLDLRIEAITLAGDPSDRGAFAPPPPAPPPPSEDTPDFESPPTASREVLYGRRAPGEIWIELGAHGSTTRDLALFTIAPFLMVPSTQPVEKLYIALHVTEGAPVGANHPTVFELSEVCRPIFGTGRVDLPSTSSTSMGAHDPVTGADKSIYLIDPRHRDQDVADDESLDSFLGEIVARGSLDLWVQDEMCVGYCWAPHGWVNVAVHCKRGAELARFVTREIAASAVGVFGAIGGAGGSGPDFGGNILVSPPVGGATPELPRGDAGPRVPPHPAAPFGKIVVGDVVARPGGQPQFGALHEHTRDLLASQIVQPLLPVDTSWLRVGHVDELLTMVPDRSSADPQAFKLLVASAEAMQMLLSELVAVPYEERTGFHRGKWDIDGAYLRYAEIEPEELLTTDLSTATDELRRLVMPPFTESPRFPSLTVAEYNSRLTSTKLRPIHERVRVGLGLETADLIPVPTFFRVPPVVDEAMIRSRHEDHRTVALTVNSVNLQVVNDHLMIPRPYGPRVDRSRAERIVTRTIRSLGLGDLPFIAPTAGMFSHWLEPGRPSWELGAYFARGLSRAERATVLRVLRRGRADQRDLVTFSREVSPTALTRIHTTYEDLQLRQGHLRPLPSFAADEAFDRWARIQVESHTQCVDLIEAYWCTILEPLRLRPHFIDSWSYHQGSGELHCATKALRRPRELDDGSLRWWNHYEPERDVSYDPAR